MKHYCGAYSYFNSRRERKWSFLEYDASGQGIMGGNLPLERVLRKFARCGVELTDQENDCLRTGKGITKLRGERKAARKDEENSSLVP